MHDASGAEYSLQAEGGDAYHGADDAEGEGAEPQHTPAR